MSLLIRSTVCVWVVSLNTAHGEMYSIQYYVIKFVSNLRQVVSFLPVAGFLHQENWNIVESGVRHPTYTPQT
jgi:hypothetical protein